MKSMNPTRLFQNVWRNKLIIFDVQRNSINKSISLECFQRQFQDLKDNNLISKDKEQIFINYEEEFSHNINEKYGRHGIIKMIENDQCVFTYKRFLNAILLDNLNLISDEDMCRILLRAHRNDPDIWKLDIPNIQDRIKIDQHDTYSHPIYTK